MAIALSSQRANFTRSPIKHRHSLAAKAIPQDATRVLDVGGYSDRAPLLTVGHPNLTYVSANVGPAWYGKANYDIPMSSARIPLADRSFEVTTCVDALEHVPPHSRSVLISEMVRVSSKRAIIVVPFSLPGRSIDEAFAVSLSERLGIKPMPSLLEHVALGLPTLKDLMAMTAKYEAKMEPATPKNMYWSSQFAMHWTSAALENAQAVNAEILRQVETELEATPNPTNFTEAYRVVITIDR